MKKDYSDIIDTQWPKATYRPRMRLQQRAKIFLPFAALKGHNEAISDAQSESLLYFDDDGYVSSED